MVADRCRALALIGVVGCGGAAAPSDSSVEPVLDGSVESVIDASAERVLATLFVGNSYVHTHDVPGRFGAMVEGVAGWSAQVAQVSPGGYLLAQHAVDARTDGTELGRWLRSDEPLDVVVLQEQSVTGALPEGYSERIASVAAAAELAALAEARGATVVLYATWGRQHGLDRPPLPFTRFALMQDHLDARYLAMAERLRAEGHATVRVAPVGAGFRAVFDDVVAGGHDPLADGSAFDALYDSDGSHPSLQGAYLAACVLAATAVEADPRGFVDEPALGPEVSARLRDACARAVAEPRWRVRSPAPEAAHVVTAPAGAEAGFGGLVRASASGKRLLVGDPAASVAQVMVRSDAGWVHEATLASSVSLSALVLSRDGTRALVGGADASGAGELRVFRRDGSAWLPEASFGGTGAFGMSIAVDAGADLALVGAPWADRVRAFRRVGTTWTEEPAPATTSGDARFGQAVALDASGERALVGAPTDRAGGVHAGSARVFVRTDAGWVEEATLVRASPIGWGHFGQGVALDGDGRRAAVVEKQGMVHVFVRTDTGWAEEARLAGTASPFDTAPDSFGTAVAWDDGPRRLVIGAPEHITTVGWASGSATTFVRDGATWREEHRLLRRGAAAGDRLGDAVAIIPDGTTVFVGATARGRTTPPAAGSVHGFHLAPP